MKFPMNYLSIFDCQKQKIINKPKLIAKGVGCCILFDSSFFGCHCTFYIFSDNKEYEFKSTIKIFLFLHLTTF